MDWIDPYQFKQDFAVAKRMTDAQAQMAIDAAVDELVEYVGQSAVDDALLASPADVPRATKLVRAHKFLAAAIILLNVRNVKREQDSDSPGTVKAVNNEYWTPKEISDMAEQWRKMAFRAIAPYLLIDVDGDEYAAAIEFDNPTLSNCRTLMCADWSC